MTSAAPADEQSRRSRHSHSEMMSGTAWYGTARELPPASATARRTSDESTGATARPS